MQDSLKTRISKLSHINPTHLVPTKKPHVAQLKIELNGVIITRGHLLNPDHVCIIVHNQCLGDDFSLFVCSESIPFATSNTSPHSVPGNPGVALPGGKLKASRVALPDQAGRTGRHTARSTRPHTTSRGNSLPVFHPFLCHPHKRMKKARSDRVTHVHYQMHSDRDAKKQSGTYLKNPY